MHYDAFKNMNWLPRCDLSKPYTAMTVRIIFSHDKRKDDKVEFHIYLWRAKQLAELFIIFCEESHYENVVITDVIIIRVAKSMDALIEMEKNS